jgi:hypothetical protein
VKVIAGRFYPTEGHLKVIADGKKSSASDRPARRLSVAELSLRMASPD